MLVAFETEEWPLYAPLAPITADLDEFEEGADDDFDEDDFDDEFDDDFEEEEEDDFDYGEHEFDEENPDAGVKKNGDEEFEEDE